MLLFSHPHMKTLWRSLQEKGFYCIYQKQLNYLEYIVSVKGLYESLEVRTQSYLPFSPHRIADVLACLGIWCNEGYLDIWFYWYLNLNETMCSYITIFICCLYCSLILKLIQWIKKLFCSMMMQVIGGISEHGYLHLNIQVNERKCYHHKIILIGKLGSKCMNKRRNVTIYVILW